MKFTVWFEPERVMQGSRLAKDHPEWLLGPKEEQHRFLDLGNPDALRWITDYIADFITEHHIDMYRQDFNVDPLGCWRYNEPADRQGITENKYVTGLLAFWDELQKRHPDMPFDNCAGGGTRNVLEMMRRGVPLSKSDHAGGATSTQCQTYGIVAWLPYFGAGCPMSKGLYVQRSNMAPWVGTAENVHKEGLDYADMRRFITEWRRVIPYYWGDYYPLTAYSLEETVWMAWQFDVPEKGEGLVQAFRREKSDEAAQVYKLRGLDPDVLYVVANLDSDSPTQISGRDLMEKGLTVEIKNKPGAALITYKQTGVKK
jgi:alpha-galactosidase